MAYSEVGTADNVTANQTWANVSGSPTFNLSTGTDYLLLIDGQAPNWAVEDNLICTVALVDNSVHTTVFQGKLIGDTHGIAFQVPESGYYCLVVSCIYNSTYATIYGWA